MESQGIETVRELHQQIIIAHQKQEYESCLALIEKSLELNPSNTSHKILKASCWTLLNINGAETFAVLKQIIKEEPKNSFAYYGIGLKHYNDGELMESIKYLNKAVELNPTNAMQMAVELKCKAQSVIEAICDANVKFETNNIEKAMRVLSTALYTDPKNIKIQEKIKGIQQFFIENLVERLESDVKDDIKEVSEKLEIEEKLKKAEDLLKSGKMEAANRLIEEAADFDSELPQLGYLKGFSFYMLGKLKKSISVLSELLQLEPNLEKVKELRAKAMKIDDLMDAAAEKMKQKKHKESIEILTKVVTIDEDNAMINQAAYFQRSMAHFNLGNSSEAFSDFKRFEALQKDTEDLKNMS